MSRYSPYLRRLQRLEPEPGYLEPWPPDVEGSLSKVLYDQMIAEGVELPVERPGKDTVMCLLEINSPRVWVDYEPARTRSMATKAGNDGSSPLSEPWAARRAHGLHGDVFSSSGAAL